MLVGGRICTLCSLGKTPAMSSLKSPLGLLIWYTQCALPWYWNVWQSHQRSGRWRCQQEKAALYGSVHLFSYEKKK